MKVDTKQIEWLLSHATAYQIAKISGVYQSAITNLINGKRQIKNLTIETGYKLTQAAIYMQQEFLRRNESLIQEVLDDLSLLGENHEVFAIVIQDGLIADYVDANSPTREEFPDSEEFDKVMSDYEKNLASLSGQDYERMTSAELLRKLESQRTVFED